MSTATFFQNDLVFNVYSRCELLKNNFSSIPFFLVMPHPREKSCIKKPTTKHFDFNFCYYKISNHLEKNKLLLL
jgi:hypothetical protein